ncbi:PilN domain-containing protein [Parathalassolituus penaei]|uniref:PilN domain-containing protein n=1 Tax=Parathalassolituus penaei TaxID=2997323 RepID=A0A9X3ITZ1_9GAMM|nr:PilN domain-containing protein [Parathalassolituus penaei]MCY0967371.1 PilN domain-containing protein [Parathalassolituus penaei]
MAKINLLPWRDAYKKQKQNEYLSVLGLVAFAAFAVVWAGKTYFDEQIAGQEYRNQYLVSQSQILDGKIKEIQELTNTRDQLIERMELIQDLQGKRPVIVRVFDEIARAVPEDLYFTDLEVKQNQVTVKGVAKSNNRVAALMRNFDRSEWFADPALMVVQADKSGGNRFEVTMKRVEPGSQEEK